MLKSISRIYRTERFKQLERAATRQLHRLLHPEINFRDYGTTWLLILSVIVAESHSYLGNFATVKQNWIYSIDRTMEMQWNVKYLSDQVNLILYFLAMFIYKENGINRATVITFLSLSIIDLGMYFHNFKTLHYGSVYVWMLLTWGAVHYTLTKFKKCK